MIIAQRGSVGEALIPNMTVRRVRGLSLLLCSDSIQVMGGIFNNNVLQSNYRFTDGQFDNNKN